MTFIELRSDTFTKPTAAMRAAMAAAEVGDDVWGEDPTARRLEERAAALLGKERALFVPTGTMGNQIALLLHCRPGDEVIVARGAHNRAYESGAGAAWAGVQFAEIGGPDGTFQAAEVLEATLPVDRNLPRTRLVCVENTHNRGGGTVLPPDTVAAVAAAARSRSVALHLDGARIWNAAVASGLPEHELAAPFDTVSACFSKGLGAPVGSVLAGPREAIDAARRFRKMLGGGMRQVGVLCARHSMPWKTTGRACPRITRTRGDWRRAWRSARACRSTLPAWRRTSSSSRRRGCRPPSCRGAWRPPASASGPSAPRACGRSPIWTSTRPASNARWAPYATRWRALDIRVSEGGFAMAAKKTARKKPAAAKRVVSKKAPKQSAKKVAPKRPTKRPPKAASKPVKAAKAPARPAPKKRSHAAVVHWEIQAADPARQRDFFSSLFGWAIDANNPQDYGMVPNGGPDSIGGGIGGTQDSTSRVTVYVEVPDINAALAKAEALGAATIMPRMDIGMVVMAQFRDLEGNLIGLVESAAG